MATATICAQVGAALGCSFWGASGMRIHLIAVGKRMPRWIEEGFVQFARRMPRECSLHLVEVAPARRHRGAEVPRLVREEGERVIKAVPAGARIVALEVGGEAWSTARLADELSGWLGSGRDVALLVGGADGQAQACRQAAARCWSLSPLTLPHGLTRIVVAEQLYRAWTLLVGHPYHR